MCLGIMFLTLSACAAQDVVPDQLKERVNTGLSFTDLQQNPEQYEGEIVVFGGEVLGAKRLPDRTRIEVLQLPLTSGQDPVMDRMESNGRFLAFQEQFLDPATVPPGTRVTIVGRVTGSTVEPLDEMDYQYPTLAIERLKRWSQPMDRPYWGRPYPAFYGYWGPYWGSYWGPYYGPSPYWW